MAKHRFEEPTSEKAETIDREESAKSIGSRALDGYALVDSAEYHPLPLLEAGLKHRIVGQDDAIYDVTRALARAELRHPDERRPKANLLFCGQNGVGKTELAKTLSVLLAANDNGVAPSFTKIDCPSYSHPQPQANSTNMKSTEPSPDLIEPIFNKQIIESENSVVLFDRLEGSPVELTRLMRSIMSDGVIRVAGSNETVSFRNAIVVLSYNINPQESARMTGFSTAKEAPMAKSAAQEAVETLKQTVTAKFMDNFDETIFFDRLNDPQMVDVLHAYTARAHERKPGRANVKVEISTKLAQAIVMSGDQRRQYGAQSVINNYKTAVESDLVDQIIAGTIPHNSTAYCDIIFDKEDETVPPRLLIHYKSDSDDTIRVTDTPEE
ncbi:MAG: AAA family ATPase [Candidatus Saccharimonadales bacterium]